VVRSIPKGIPNRVLLTYFSIFLSDDKDAITVKRTELVKMKKDKNTTTAVRRELFSEASVNPPALVNVSNKRPAEVEAWLLLIAKRCLLVLIPNSY
jgi:hypothetical protein